MLYCFGSEAIINRLGRWELYVANFMTTSNEYPQAKGQFCKSGVIFQALMAPAGD